MLLTKLDSKRDEISQIYDSITTQINNLTIPEFKQIINYLQFSQTQLSNDELYNLTSDRSIQDQPLGTGILSYEDDNLEFAEGQTPAIEIQPEDENLFLPLVAATKRSRKEMVEQATVLAKQFLFLDSEKNVIPPTWWLNREDGIGLKSSNALIYVPTIIESEKVPQVPPTFQKLLNNPGFRRGWNLITLSKTEPKKIIDVLRITL